LNVAHFYLMNTPMAHLGAAQIEISSKLRYFSICTEKMCIPIIAWLMDMYG
jgi:hypothetical protein